MVRAALRGEALEPFGPLTIRGEGYNEFLEVPTNYFTTKFTKIAKESMVF
jgi:hypothetical protein